MFPRTDLGTGSNASQLPASDLQSPGETGSPPLFASCLLVCMAAVHCRGRVWEGDAWIDLLSISKKR